MYFSRNVLCALDTSYSQNGREVREMGSFIVCVCPVDRVENWRESIVSCKKIN